MTPYFQALDTLAVMRARVMRHEDSRQHAISGTGWQRGDVFDAVTSAVSSWSVMESDSLVTMQLVAFKMEPPMLRQFGTEMDSDCYNLGTIHGVETS